MALHIYVRIQDITLLDIGAYGEEQFCLCLKTGSCKCTLRGADQVPKGLRELLDWAWKGEDGRMPYLA